MSFDDLDKAMRVFETAHDHCVLPGIHMVVRLDGRGFTRLTKEVHRFEAPFDERVRDMMLRTTEHLVASTGFRVLLGYTQSDEISLLLSRDEKLFGRKERKIISVLAGEASAKFSLELGGLGIFDGRISQLPSAEHVVDYFRWRSEDALRNALSAHCYWLLRREGLGVEAATSRLEGAMSSDKHELLFSRGINFDGLPAWQKRGSGIYWESYDKPAVNPITQQATVARRRRLKLDLDLPVRQAFDDFVRERLVEDRD